MRTINKYRGFMYINVYQTDGAWIYGYLADENHINSKRSGWYLSVDKDTVGQYIGVDDKNGKEIYEGDIVRVIEDFEEIYVVEWDEDIARYVLTQNGATMCYFGDIYGDDMEVIGNVYENADLLKEVRENEID